jgi:hypothetical protein
MDRMIRIEKKEMKDGSNFVCVAGDRAGDCGVGADRVCVAKAKEAVMSNEEFALVARTLDILMRIVETVDVAGCLVKVGELKKDGMPRAARKEVERMEDVLLGLLEIKRRRLRNTGIEVNQDFERMLGGG